MSVLDINTHLRDAVSFFGIFEAKSLLDEANLKIENLEKQILNKERLVLMQAELMNNMRETCDKELT